MNSPWIPAVLSFFAPGAGQALRERPARGAAWFTVWLLWASLCGVILMKVLSLIGSGAGAVMVTVGPLLPLSGIVLQAACAWDAYRLPGEPPQGKQWVMAAVCVAVVWIGSRPLGMVINAVALRAVVGPAANEILAGERQADALVGQIEKMGKGVFAADEERGFLIDRYDDKFPLPSGYHGKGESLEGVEEGQRILLYPPSVGQRMALPSANDSEHQWLEMGLISVGIEKDADAGVPDRVAKFESLLQELAKQRPAMGASVARRDDLRWPALVMTFSEPKYVKVYVFGAKKRYGFSAAAAGEPLESILKGFQEGQGDPPGMKVFDKP